VIETTEIELETAKGLASFAVMQLDGTRGAKLLLRLTSRFAPALKGLQGSNGMDGLAALAERLSPEEYEAVQHELLVGRLTARFPTSGDVVSTFTSRTLADTFQGHPLELMRLVLHALESNFPFVGALRERAMRAIEIAQASLTSAKSSSPTTPAGSAGPSSA
jgi:hypothetical protein